MADYSWLNDRLSQPDYNNWVKGNIILQELKTALVQFLDDKARGLHHHVLIHVAASGTVCTVCTGDDLRKKRHICQSAGICSTILQAINTEYIHHPPGLVKLMNTDNKAWCNTARYWEIAKAYISTPGYASKMSAAETDCAGLLTIIINCKWVQKFLSVSNVDFQKVKDLRNDVMHSANYTLAADQLEKLYDICIKILQEKRYFADDSTAKAALARITEIKTIKLSISSINVPDLLFIVEEMKAEVDTHREEIKEIELSISELKSEDDKHREAIGHLETQSAALETSSQNLKLWQEELEKQKTEQKLAISKLDITVSELDTTVSELDTTVSELDTTVTQLDTTVSQLDTTVSQLDTTVSQLDTTVSELDTTVSQHDTRLLSLEARNRPDNIQMTEELDKMKNYLINTKYKVEILQSEPNMWFEMKDILHMFVPLEIREDLERWMALTSTERKKVRRGQASDGKKIESWHDIFYKGSERQYNIFLLGEAGVGKSTFCHQLVDNWCRVQDSESKTDYESVLKSFAFLFFIQARYSDKSQTVYEMIKKQLCPLKYHKVLEELFTSQPESCLVLIDGLDEWQSGTSRYQKLPNVTEIEDCTILITSRQWRVEALDCNLGSSCRVLEIQGLDSSGIENLADKVFEAFKRKDNPSADCKSLVKQFMHKIKLLKLNSFAKIPFLLIILVKSWLNGNTNLENARGFIYSGLIESLLVHSDEKLEYTGTSGRSTNTQALPNCFDKKQHCLNYRPLIHELSRLAFEMLFSDEKEHSLVFTKQDLAEQLDVKEHLTLCLKLGLLTETKSFSETKESQRSFSFPHKSIQEYFCSVYLGGEGFETGFTRFCEIVTTPDDVFDFENVVLFLSSMNGTHCKKLFDYICSIVFHRKFAHEYLYLAGRYMFVKVHNIRKIEQLGEQCTAEATHSLPEASHTGESQFVIPDLVVYKSTPEHKVEQFCSLGLNIKSLVYERDVSHTTVTPFSVVESIRTMTHIQRLGIGCTAENTEKYIVCICKYLSDLHQLNSFSFSVDDEDSTVRLPIHVSTELVSKLGTLPNLVSAHVHRLDLSDITTCQFTSQLTSLGLKYTKSLSPGVVSGWCKQLHTLYMLNVYLSPAAVDQLRQHLMTSSSLQSLTLFLPDMYMNLPDICHYFPYTVFDDVLDLTSHTSLHTLSLCVIDLKSGVRIHPGHNWRNIDMRYVSMSEYMWQEFIQNLPTEPLQQLHVKLDTVKSLNTQTMSYIRDKFCVTKDIIYSTDSDSTDSDSTDSDMRRIEFNTKH